VKENMVVEDFAMDIEDPEDEEFEFAKVNSETPSDKDSSTDTLAPFPSAPPFPAEKYQSAWNAVKKHRQKTRSVKFPVQSTRSSDTSPVPANHSVRDDQPIVPGDVNVSVDSGDGVKVVLEGESLRQVEESKVISGKTKKGKVERKTAK
jgi:hypothetical protein